MSVEIVAGNIVYSKDVRVVNYYCEKCGYNYRSDYLDFDKGSENITKGLCQECKGLKGGGEIGRR